MAAFLGLLGWLLWGPPGLLILVSVGLVGVVFNPAVPPGLIMRLYGGRPVDLSQVPALAHALDRLAARAGLAARPTLHYVPSRVLNAFAVGTPNESAIALSDGMFRQFDLRELVGVLAHEVSHIRSNDLRVMGLADLFSRATSLLSLVGQFLLILSLPLVLFADVGIPWLAIGLLILAPNLSALAQLALSRTREHDADLNAARLTGDPEGLARALAKLEQAQGGLWEQVFLPGRRVPDPSLLRSHPATDERIRRLLELRGRIRERDLPLFGRAPLDIRGIAPARVTRAPRWHLSGLWH
jgi:heat shock protein HtpX